MQLVPTEFFVASASASSDVSELNAFDNALIKMGIGELNLVPVSSVIPIGAKEIEFCELPMGSITHCVLSKIGCVKGTISAGIAYAFRKDGRGGYVVEGNVNVLGDSLKESLERKMKEIADSRNVELDEIHYVTAEMDVPEGKFGTCVAALIFTRYD
jgi:arginine decarboxylase